MEKRSRPGFGRKFKFIHLIIVALVVMIVTAAATYLITTGGFGAQKYYNDAKAYVEIERSSKKTTSAMPTATRFITPPRPQWFAALTISGAIT